ncbi:hypothetical protein ASE14_01080 [Agromyces sp. Root81]|uniref:hypothetical protein n=1 Tax=Agromyces sp. Root81 TaxID=1736601 RepID=UPI0006F9AD6D|nr:hypothetical protein [Agromyces sp. Root81]KRC62462.1 hypothetical protein ASE14_01080 [Agromyces sp. Root81]
MTADADQLPDQPYRTMQELFSPAPFQWGLRGDPHVWLAMKERLGATPSPADALLAEVLLIDTFNDVVGVDVRDQHGDTSVYREEFAHGGMSSGQVHVEGWRERLIPLLVSRAAELTT